MNRWDNHFQIKIAEQTKKDLLRKLRLTDSNFIDFTSNDYLGLARSETLFDQIHERVQIIGKRNGSTGSRLLSGNSEYAEFVEERLAKVFNTESAVLFNSGYTANLAVLSSIPQKNDTIIYDELAHASIKDGARLSLAKRYSFKHNDLHDLETKIKKSTGNIFIVVESVYSMDGDECPLVELVSLAERHDALLIVDEAHSTGVVGENGSGLACELNLEKKIAVRIHTFGKAMGVHGACVAGSLVLREYLINFARPYIYTTALPLHSLASIECSFEYLRNHIHLQKELKENIIYYLNNMQDVSNRTHSSSAIQTVIIPGNKEVKQIARTLQENHFDIRPIVSPTVRKGLERLRICIHTYNTNEEIDMLTKHLKSFKISTPDMN